MTITPRRKALPPESAPESAGAQQGGALSFEESMQRLGAIVEELEGGELSLEDALRRFEEGVRLARSSQARLDAAEARIEELMRVEDGGQPVVRELDAD